MAFTKTRPIPLTVCQAHINKYKDCRACGLWETRRSVVFARGQVPAEVCFVGEAPGISENLLGEPFVGPAGHLLDRIIQQASLWYTEVLKRPPPTYCLTNLIMCIPLDEDGVKAAEPSPVEVEACSGRLKEF